jgi:hypothetical protein
MTSDRRLRPGGISTSVSGESRDEQFRGARAVRLKGSWSKEFVRTRSAPDPRRRWPACVAAPTPPPIGELPLLYLNRIRDNLGSIGEWLRYQDSAPASTSGLSPTGFRALFDDRWIDPVGVGCWVWASPPYRFLLTVDRHGCGGTERSGHMSDGN